MAGSKIRNDFGNLGLTTEPHEKHGSCYSSTAVMKSLINLDKMAKVKELKSWNSGTFIPDFFIDPQQSHIPLSYTIRRGD